MMPKAAFLALSQIETYYGKSRILQGVSFDLPRGRITAVLGRNGAGKTTTLKSIMGLVPPRAGTIRFDGQNVTGLSPHRCFRLGLGYVPEGREIFPHLTVAQNLRVAAPAHAEGFWTQQRIFECFPVLQERRHQVGLSLSGGEQQMLAIARALVGNPRLLMLDEPSQGLAPRLVQELQSTMLNLKSEGVTVLLVEQNVKVALAVCDRVVVLSKGAVVFAGTIDEFRKREEEINRLYLAL
jgi:branched-chain amino acid transport system ATP-binding protein